MKKSIVLIVVAAFSLLSTGLNSSADSITHGATTVNMEFVEIGFSGNMVDSNIYNNIYGSVNYDYRIGKYEVSADQWADVISADSRVGIDQGYWSVFGVNKPQAYISWYAAAKFCNWLTTGDAYTGAYQFDGSGNLTNVLARTEMQTAGGSYYVIPTEDEWYKAAYFKSDGSGYTWYSTGNNDPGVETDANYGGTGGSYSAPWDAGTGNPENNGTFDMNGNVYEWLESAFDGTLDVFSEDRTVRGGCYENTLAIDFLHSKSRFAINPLGEDELIGFRIVHVPASVAVEMANVHYVDINNVAPIAPYTNWVTAATNIQDAVDVASINDTVLVTNGTYLLTAEILVTNDIIIRSVNGHEVTIVDGGGAGRCFNVSSSACVIGGFTVTNGYSTGNSAVPNEARGGGVYCAAGSVSAVVSNCVLAGNTATHLGGGMYYGTAVNCLFTENHANFSGGGKYGGVLQSCTLANNSASSNGGGVDGSFLYPGTVQNSIVYGNTAPSAPDNMQFLSSCSPFATSGVDGNITNTPVFANEGGGDYRLSAASPCIDAGSNTWASSSTDLDGNPRIVSGTVDMGAYEFIPPVQGVVFGSGTNQFIMQFVDIGYPGNVADGTGYGSVDYYYRIGIHEVTIEQFTKAFASDSRVGDADEDHWDTGLETVGSNAPASYVHWHEAAKFCNWLTSGDAHAGAYTISGGAVVSIDRQGAIDAYGTVYVLPTENEWYKAAYFKQDGSGYSLYANGTNTPPLGGTNDNPEANYYDNGYVNTAPNYVWPVGSGAEEQNGTYDMMGNVWEWEESAWDGVLNNMAEDRTWRGGAYPQDVGKLISTFRTFSHPINEAASVGFRVASIGGHVQWIVNSPHGNPIPPLGTNVVTYGIEVTNSVEAVVNLTTTQYVCLGSTVGGVTNWFVQTALEDTTVDWLWDTNYWVGSAVSGSGSVSIVDGWYAAGSNVAVVATPDPSWLFTGWTGDLSGDYTTSNQNLLVDAPKSFVAFFSDDADGDGLSNTNEWAAGTDPRNPDSDGDGFNDNFEVTYGYNPTNSDAVILDYIRNNGDVFGLYTTNVLLDVAMGQMALSVTNDNADLWLQLLQSEDLVIWTNAGPAVYWSLPVDADKRFFRVRAEP